MKFYCIVSDSDNLANPDTYSLLREAAQSQGYEFVAIDAAVTAPSDLHIEQGSMMYRLGVSSQAKFLEACLYREDIATLYVDYANLLARAFPWGSTLRLKQAGLPSISTIFSPGTLSNAGLQDAVARLGGFPVVVKSAGGSHGDGVRKADSQDELKSTVSNEATRQKISMRAFIHDARHIRVVVVGDTALDAIEYDVQPDDFRTNAVAAPTVRTFNMTKDPLLCKVSIEAVRVLGLEFGGIDILLQPNGDFWIAEVNFPCNFARNQLNTGADISGAIVRHLASKAVLVLGGSA